MENKLKLINELLELTDKGGETISSIREHLLTLKEEIEDKSCYVCNMVSSKNYLTNLGRFENKEHDIYLCLRCKIEMQRKINKLINN